MREEMDNWKFDKTISADHILTAMIIAGAVLAFVLNYENRVSKNEANILNNKEAIIETREYVKDSFGEIKDRLVRIETKLDEKQDKGNQ